MLSLHYMKRKPHDLKNSLERICKYNWYQNSRGENKTAWGRGTSRRLHGSVLVAVWRFYVFRFIWKPGRADQTYDVKLTLQQQEELGTDLDSKPSCAQRHHTVTSWYTFQCILPTTSQLCHHHLRGKHLVKSHIFEKIVLLFANL